MSNYIRVPYGCSVHGEEEIQAVVDVLRTSSQMSVKVKEFEEKIANLFAHKHGIMTNSGSSALYLLIESMRLPEGSEVITPALTFSTTVGCLVKNNLKPHFVDVGYDTFCADFESIKSAINPNTSAILSPDLMGNVCEWDKIYALAKENNIKVIIDSADTLGAKLDGVSTGEYADAAITSFYGSHVINGAGNGGMLITSDEMVMEKSRLLRSWGRSSSLFSDNEAIENRFNVDLNGFKYDAKFVFEQIGYQLEPSEISAAFALVQLKKLDLNTKIRINNFNANTNFFSNPKYKDFFILPNQNPRSESGWLAFPMIVREDAPFTRTDMQIFLEQRNIQTRVVFTGNILRQPGFKSIDCIGSADDFKNADNAMRGGILLALHHGLTQEMQDHFFDSSAKFLDAYC
jgi:CDP-6-deoxy-D-xylo-4-hexulose-3-dehydrase